jgi:hemerythrin
MDVAHRLQADLIRGLENAARSPAMRPSLQDLVLRLFEETSEHFAVEHELMRASRFPGRKAHIEEHDRLLRQLSRLLESFGKGHGIVTLATARSLKRGLARHVKGKDRVLARHVRRRRPALNL